jgi:hypothetical protein
MSPQAAEKGKFLYVRVTQMEQQLKRRNKNTVSETLYKCYPALIKESVGKFSHILRQVS